jgi:tetratricopeptide (TPR) repeat protein
VSLLAKPQTAKQDQNKTTQTANKPSEKSPSPKALDVKTPDTKSNATKSIASKSPVTLKTLVPLKSEEAKMAFPQAAPKHQESAMPPAAPSISSSLGQPGWHSTARDLLREGLRLHSSGQYREAEVTFRKVLTVDPRNADAFYNLGSLAERNHDYVMALTNYRAALALSPKDKDYLQAVTAMENQLSSESKSHPAKFPAYGGSTSTSPLGGSTSTTPAGGSASLTALDGSSAGPPFQLSGTQNDVLLNTTQYNPPSVSVGQNAPAPTMGVSQNSPVPTIGVSQRPPKRGTVGVIMNVGLSAALRGSGLHCPICRMMGGGFHF